MQYKRKHRILRREKRETLARMHLLLWIGMVIGTWGRGGDAADRWRVIAAGSVITSHAGQVVAYHLPGSPFPLLRAAGLHGQFRMGAILGP
jgi:hypothetical protein